MARFEASVAVDMINPDVYYGTVVDATSTQIVISDGFNSSVYEGYGFIYSGYTVTGGTLTGYYAYQGSLLVGQVSDFSIPAPIAYAYIQQNNLAGLFQIGLSGDDLILGSAYSDALAGYGGHDAIDAGYGDDIVLGGYGNDIIDGGPGTNYIDGGPGLDTSFYSGFSSSYQYRLNSDGSVDVTDAGMISDHLGSVERLMFSDGVLAFDLDGNAGQAYRLYQAAFDRVPDTEGLSYWIGRLDSGTTNLAAVADSFIHSPEFMQTYGTPETVGNAQYVELLYNHTLGRVSDQEGYNYWVDKLDHDATNRGDLLAFFSESDENYARVEPDIHDGIWFIA
ncbi:DUF4214 domain-containing protein [Mesorhizobium sp. A556]